MGFTEFKYLYFWRIFKKNGLKEYADLDVGLFQF